MPVDLSLFSLEVSGLLSSRLQPSLHPQIVLSSHNPCPFSIGNCLGLSAPVELTRLHPEVVLHPVDLSPLSIGGLSLSAHCQNPFQSKVICVVNL